MGKLQTESERRPNGPAIDETALHVLTRLQMMSLAPDSAGGRLREFMDAGLAPGEWLKINSSLEEAQIGRAALAATGDSAKAWQLIADAIEVSPYPDGEWEPARRILGDALLASLLGVSAASVRRYAGRERTTPDGVAERLHELGRITAALLGSYNDYGVRRWFGRARTQLDGHAPQDVLNGQWAPDDPAVIRVVALAEALTHAGAGA